MADWSVAHCRYGGDVVWGQFRYGGGIVWGQGSFGGDLAELRRPFARPMAHPKIGPKFGGARVAGDVDVEISPTSLTDW